MQVEVVFCIAGTGADLLRSVFRGNRGRLRRQGVHMADAACPALLRRHHAAIAGVEDAGLAEANAQTQKELADKGVRRLVFVHEFDVPLQIAAQQSNASALEQHMQDALVLILAGFDQAKTTVHLYAEQSENIAVRFWLANDDPDKALQTFATYCGTSEVRFDEIGKRITQVFPEIALVVRDNDLREIDPKGFVIRFFRDIGVRRSSLKVVVQDQLNLLTGEQCKRIGNLLTQISELDQSQSSIQSALEQIRQETPTAPLADHVNTAVHVAQEPLTIYFMVEPGPLELQAHLLIASLEVNCRDAYRLVAFCRDDRADDLNPATKDFLASTKTELRTLTNTFADGYPAGNKLIAASLVKGSGWSLFMDTDMMLARPTAFMSQAAGRRVSVCVDTVNGWTHSDAQWDALAQNIGMANLGPKIVLRGGATSYPLYNAGLILFPPAGPSTGDFGQVWLETALQLDRDEAIENKRPWLDTIALAACVIHAQSARPISEDWNCTTRNATVQTRVLHYHGLRQLRQFDWEDRANAILKASSSPYDTLDAAVIGHRNDMGVKGDLWRRAMRHGHLNT
jgi:hypothetical protein